MTPAEIEPATFRFVARHLSHCATAAPTVQQYASKITLDNKFQTIVCICDEYVINLFVRISEVKKWTIKKIIWL